MDDLISRQAAIKKILGQPPEPHYPSWYAEQIKELPPAEPKRGKWIDRGERGDWEWQADGRGKHWHEWECNTCHHYFAERSFFCPHCGSDMREVTG